MMGGEVNKDSVNIINRIPENSVGAEIGVWMGNTSSQFLKRNLTKLHLVDSWSVIPYKDQPNNEHGSYQQYLKRYSKLVGSSNPDDFQRYYDNVYDKVKRKFADRNEVVIHRMTSTEFFNTFTEEKLDWIYIDGDHSFEGCYNDLKRALEVVKPGGYIFGDDYRWSLKAGKPGVTKAVNTFLDETNYIIKQFGEKQFEIKIL